MRRQQSGESSEADDDEEADPARIEQMKNHFKQVMVRRPCVFGLGCHPFRAPLVREPRLFLFLQPLRCFSSQTTFLFCF